MDESKIREATMLETAKTLLTAEVERAKELQAHADAREARMIEDIRSLERGRDQILRDVAKALTIIAGRPCQREEEQRTGVFSRLESMSGAEPR